LAHLEQAAQGTAASADLRALDAIADQIIPGLRELEAIRASSAAAGKSDKGEAVTPP
jgi:hypothetical protein